jgi:hypothetical protein
MGRRKALNQLRVAAAGTKPSHHDRGSKKEEEEDKNEGGGSTAVVFVAVACAGPVSEKGKRGKRPV